MKVYGVFRCGIYRHFCVGIFASLETAKKIAIDRRDMERDSYHSFCVYGYDVDCVLDNEHEDRKPVFDSGKKSVNEICNQRGWSV